MDSETERKEALAKNLKVEVEDIEHLYDNTFEADGGEYLVLTDDEADEAWNDSLDNYIDDCILPEIAEPYRMYFDDEKWKDDAKVDGRGHSLASYDGGEDYEDINGTTYYIYRVN